MAISEKAQRWVIPRKDLIAIIEMNAWGCIRKNVSEVVKINDGNIYINDLRDIYPGKSVLEINDVLLQLGKDSKKIKIRESCSVCGEEVVTTPGTYRKQKSFKCAEHMRRKPKGSNSPFYNRVSCECTNCETKLELTPFDFNKKNKFGDSHHFCSQKCYWEYRSKYYVGEKGSMYQYKRTPEQLAKMAAATAMRVGKQNRLNSKAQLIVNGILEGLGVVYEREYFIDYYSCDNYLLEHKLIIEVMGDYWHGNPKRYNEDKYRLNKIQQKTILKDKQKKGYIEKKYGVSILYIWESDLNKESKKCEALIQHYIENKGKIENYHSFNYAYKNNELLLKDSLVTPYQAMSSKDYLALVS